MKNIISVSGLSKTYASGFQALKNINLDIQQGEILALLGPNGAGKTTPLTFLGGSFYAIDMLPPFWQTVSLFNPVVYLVSAFRWSFHGTADVHIGVSISMTLLFLAAFLGVEMAHVSVTLEKQGLNGHSANCRSRRRCQWPARAATGEPLRMPITQETGRFNNDGRTAPTPGQA